MKRYFIISFLLLLFAESSSSQALPANLNNKPDKVYSFENGIPSSFKSKGGKLEASTLRYGEGKHSLYWKANPGDKLFYNGEIGYHPQKSKETVVIHGREHPQVEYPVALSFSIYNEKQSDAKLKMTFGRNSETDCFSYVLLNFEGWRHVALMYDRGHFIGEPHPDMDECTFEIDGTEEVGIFIDELNFKNSKLNPIHNLPPKFHLPTRPLHCNRKVSGAWRFPDTHLNRPWFPLTTPTSDEMNSLETIESRMNTLHFKLGKRVELLSEKEMELIRKEFKSLNITEKNGIINGPLYHFDRKIRTKNNKLMKKMGILHHQTKDENQKKELADKIILLYKHGKQMDIHIGWYDGRGFAGGLYLIKEELKNRGLLEEVIAFIRSRYRFNRVYDESTSRGFESKGEDSDVMYTNLLSEIMTVLMMNDGPEKVRDMYHYSSFLSNTAFNYSNSIRDGMKPDGSHFHHGSALLYGYGNYTPAKMAFVARLLGRTSFKINEKAHERLKQHARVRYFASTPLFYPDSYSQIIFRNSRNILTDPYLHLAYTGTPDGEQEIDTEMAALLADTANTSKLSDDAKKLLKKYPEKAPIASGHHTMTYYSKGLHRFDNRLVAVGSHSRYCFAMERWDRRGDASYTQFVNWGSVEVILPDTLGATGANNGIALKGWDYTRFPGATTIKAPIDNYKIHILDVGDDHDEHLYSDQAFVGGLDFSDGNGLFVSPVHGHYKYGLESFFAKKSYFFFGDLIICMGTNIRTNIPEYETQTTLFQNSLLNVSDPVFVNKTKSISKFPYVSECSDKKSNWLIDNRDVGYYIPIGQNLNVQKTTQVADYGEKESGNFASAWLNHGKAPEDASYEYAIKLKTSPKEMKKFADSMDSKIVPYKVLKADADAHIVKHEASNTTALILFQKDYELNVGKIKGVTLIISYGKRTG